MKKRIMIVFICFFLLFPIFSFFQPRQASANAVVKIVAGSTVEKVMIGIAEKAGVKFATKTAREKALERWNWDWKELDKITDEEIRQRLANFETQIKQEPVPIPDKPGYGQVLIDAALFLTGLDIILEGYNAFKNAYQQQKYADGLAASMSAGTYVKYFPGFDLVKYRVDAEEGWTDWRLYNAAKNYYIDVLGGYGNVDGYPFDWYFEVKSIGSAISYNLNYNYQHPEQGVKIGVKTGLQLFTSLLGSGPVGTAIPVTQSDVPDVSHVPQPIIDPLVAPGIQSVPQVQGLPEQIPIVVPLSEPYPDPATQTEPLNDPDTLIQPSPEPGGDPNQEPNPETGEDLPKTSPSDHANRWKQLVTTKFPFSLPFDLYNVLAAINAEPVKPVLKLDATSRIGGMTVPLKFTQNIDFLDPYVPFFRTFILISYVLFLIFSTRRLLGGGQ